MKKIIFGIFAHPDDEAFGPCGTLLMERLAGNDVHLICATAGESGVNPDNYEDLAAERLKEWRHAGEMIGAKSMHHLGYKDGHLRNVDFHDVARDIDTIVGNILKDAPKDVEVEFMSIDLNGITGHLDHIFVGRVACYVFCNLKKRDSRVTRLRLACLPEEYAPESNCDWLYMDAGRSNGEIGDVVDAREHVNTVYSIMRAHYTQRSDCEAHIARLGEKVAVNHFLVIE